MAAALFSTTGEMAHLHRLVTRITLVGAASSALILVVVGAVGGEAGFMFEAIGPALTSLFILPMVLRRRESAAVTFALATLSVILTYKFVGSPSTTVAATTAIVVMASLSTLFITRFLISYIGIGMVALSMTPVLWDERLEGALATGLVMALAFLVASVAFILVRNAAGQLNSRYRLAFEDAPVALVELDMSNAIAFLEEQRIEDLESALAEASDLLGQLVGRTDVTRANAAAASLLEVSDQDELVGPVHRQFASGPLRPWWVAQYIAVSERRHETTHEVSLAEWGIEKWVAVRTIRGRHPSSTGTMMLAMTDITATRLHEKSLTDLIDAKDEFIATVSHELRTPLTAVVGLASELAQENFLAADERADLLDIVVGQAREISFIVEDLLVAARADIGRITVVTEPVDLARIAAEVCSELAADVNIEIEGSPPHVIGDPIRMRQVVRNLLVNAERYGGQQRRIVILAHESTGCLEVRDNGTPIPNAARERIFEAYERAHDRQGRTMAMGLGLSVSRRLARLMEGELEYLYDGESVFRFTLPRVVVLPDQVPEEAENPAAAISMR